MNTLLAGMENKRYIEILLTLTKISSDDVKDALFDHLCKGHSVDVAAALNGTKAGSVSRAVAKLEVVNKIHIKLNECD